MNEVNVKTKPALHFLEMGQHSITDPAKASTVSVIMSHFLSEVGPTLILMMMVIIEGIRLTIQMPALAITITPGHNKHSSSLELRAQLIKFLSSLWTIAVHVLRQSTLLHV